MVLVLHFRLLLALELAHSGVAPLEAPAPNKGTNTKWNHVETKSHRLMVKQIYNHPMIQ